MNHKRKLAVLVAMLVSVGAMAAGGASGSGDSTGYTVGGSVTAEAYYSPRCQWEMRRNGMRDFTRLAEPPSYDCAAADYFQRTLGQFGQNWQKPSREAYQVWLHDHAAFREDAGFKAHVELLQRNTSYTEAQGCSTRGEREAMVLNPDVRQANIQQTICTPGYTASVRPSTSYTNGVKRKLLRQAGQSEFAISDYELDHIVSLALGGHPRSLDNLMLQPWEGRDGAKRKDRLEVKLQCLVCTGQVPLDEAQREIYRDWQGAYRRYATLKCHRSRKPRAEPRRR